MLLGWYFALLGWYFAPLGPYFGSVWGAGNTEGVRARCSAKPLRPGAWSRWHGIGGAGGCQLVGFCSCSVGDARPSLKSCKREMGRIPPWVERRIFYIPRVIFRRPPQYLFHPGWCLQKAFQSLAMPWLLPTALALRLRCRQRMLQCREKAPRHQRAPSPSPLGPFGGRAQKALLLPRRGVAEGTGGHLGASSPLPEDASGWLVPASLPKQKPQDKLHFFSSNLGFLENKAVPEARPSPEGCGRSRGKLPDPEAQTPLPSPGGGRDAQAALAGAREGLKSTTFAGCSQLPDPHLPRFGQGRIGRRWWWGGGVGTEDLCSGRSVAVSLVSPPRPRGCGH